MKMRGIGWCSLLLLLHMLMLPGIEGTVTILMTNETFHLREAAFGPRISPAGIRGALFPFEVIDFWNSRGCSPSTPPSTNFTWIALVQQGDCPYVEKVRNSQRMGAAAVIVGGNNPNAGLITMQASGDTSDITIPAVFVVYQDYITLRDGGIEHYPEFPNYQVLLLREESSYWPIVNVILARVLAPALIMIFLYGMAFKCRQSHRKKTQEEREERVFNLPKRIFDTKQENSLETLCSICLDNYQDADEIRILPCKHEFHLNCVDPWLLTRKKYCPLCKAPAFPDEETNLV